MADLMNMRQMRSMSGESDAVMDESGRPTQALRAQPNPTAAAPAPGPAPDAMSGESNVVLDENGQPTNALRPQPEAGADPATQMLDEYMSGLPEQQKAFVLDHMTPEIAAVMGIVLGAPAYQYFSKYTNPEIVLVPIPRAEAAKMMQSQQGTQAPQMSPVPQSGPMAAPAQPAVANPRIAPAQ